ncbi:trypsin-domain-containing protein [Stemphylium lycopersici]|uniref:Trypsin-domain-containing protein n=1 Tax=Stemphylium lycopersici TaxID=183478 RepID=A0A364NDR1_STELY|nr:trypsin [Stemphylium lycopersici]RAR10400.1 trypsin-domain-containing protein [Stemphylium lycopersici]RAR15231.1 trypsin-domain-containing protein [Stemphylium lycopersici]
MQIKELITLLALPAVVLSAAIPQDPTEIPDWENGSQDDIVGGSAASAGEFPFIVSLQRSGSHFCGGTLLNANTVLTAAHCAVGQSASSLTIRAGSLSRTSGGVTARVASIKVNPGYTSSTFNGDLAIMKLATSIPTSSTIGYATLPASGSDPAAGTTLTVAGWGTTSSGGTSLPTNLLKVDVPVVSRSSCQASYGTSAVTTQMFCAGLAAGGKDSCQGDSGGPIINKSTKVVLGAVSWGNGCAAPNAPGVYANIGQSTLRTFVAANL